MKWGDSQHQCVTCSITGFWWSRCSLWGRHSGTGPGPGMGLPVSFTASVTPLLCFGLTSSFILLQRGGKWLGSTLWGLRGPETISSGTGQYQCDHGYLNKRLILTFDFSAVQGGVCESSSPRSNQQGERMKLDRHDDCNEYAYQKWYQAYCCTTVGVGSSSNTLQKWINLGVYSVELVFLAVVVIFPSQLASAVLSSP